MGLGDLFKGYVFLKSLKIGIGLVLAGIMFTGGVIVNRDFTYLLCSLPVLLVGAVALYISYRIWSKEKEKDKMRSPYHSENRVEIGYSREDSGPGRAEVCPECGEKQMMVHWDGSGLCENCGKTTSDYSEEVEGDD